MYATCTAIRFSSMDTTGALRMEYAISRNALILTFLKLFSNLEWILRLAASAWLGDNCLTSDPDLRKRSGLGCHLS
jgi:hypothetical protein